MLFDPKKVTAIKRRISQNLRHTPILTLRAMVTPPLGRQHRRDWLKRLEIPWCCGIEDYMKRRIGFLLGIIR